MHKKASNAVIDAKHKLAAAREAKERNTLRDDARIEAARAALLSAEAALAEFEEAGDGE